MQLTRRLTKAYCPTCQITREFDEYEEGKYFKYKCRICGYLAIGKILKE